jgi:hypothetical protein
MTGTFLVRTPVIRLHVTTVSVQTNANKQCLKIRSRYLAQQILGNIVKYLLFNIPYGLAQFPEQRTYTSNALTIVTELQNCRNNFGCCIDVFVVGSVVGDTDEKRGMGLSHQSISPLVTYSSGLQIVDS